MPKRRAADSCCVEVSVTQRFYCSAPHKIRLRWSMRVGYLWQTGGRGGRGSTGAARVQHQIAGTAALRSTGSSQPLPRAQETPVSPAVVNVSCQARLRVGRYPAICGVISAPFNYFQQYPERVISNGVHLCATTTAVPVTLCLSPSLSLSRTHARRTECLSFFLCKT